MEYFDFEDASHLGLLPDFDEISSTCPEGNEGDIQSCFEALFFDKSSSLPTDQPVAKAPPSKRTLDTRDVEIIPYPNDQDGYPMFRAKEPCDLCRKMGLDCFVSQRGKLVYGCTCCECLCYNNLPITRHLTGEKVYRFTESVLSLTRKRQVAS
jgi:hypothetical protein